MTSPDLLRAGADAGAPMIDRLLVASRTGIERVEPSDLAAEVGSGALVVDIRPSGYREAEGPLPGAVVVERIHLEWRLDPSSPHRIPEAVPGRRVIVVCNEGYSSSLAAAVLVDLGVDRAADLVGGYRAWRKHADLASPSRGSA